MTNESPQPSDSVLTPEEEETLHKAMTIVTIKAVRLRNARYTDALEGAAAFALADKFCIAYEGLARVLGIERAPVWRDLYGKPIGGRVVAAVIKESAVPGLCERVRDGRDAHEMSEDDKRLWCELLPR